MQVNEVGWIVVSNMEFAFNSFIKFNFDACALSNPS